MKATPASANHRAHWRPGPEGQPVNTPSAPPNRQFRQGRRPLGRASEVAATSLRPGHGQAPAQTRDGTRHDNDVPVAGLRSRTRVSLFCQPLALSCSFSGEGLFLLHRRVSSRHRKMNQPLRRQRLTANCAATAPLSPLRCCPAPLAASAAVAARCQRRGRPALRATLRAHLKNPAFTLDRKAEYVVTDAAVVEPAIDEALRFVDTGKPLSVGELRQCEVAGRPRYRRGLYAAGLRALEALIASRFAQPRVTEEANDNGRHPRHPGSWPHAGAAEVPTAVAHTRWRRSGPATALPSSAFVARTIATLPLPAHHAERVAIRFTLPTFRRQGNTLSLPTPWLARVPRWLGHNPHQFVPPGSSAYETRVYNDDFSPHERAAGVYENCTGLLYLPNSQAEAERLGACRQMPEPWSRRR